MNRRELLEELNRDLETEYSAALQFIINSRKASGMNENLLAKRLGELVGKELKHAETLSDKIIPLRQPLH